MHTFSTISRLSVHYLLFFLCKYKLMDILEQSYKENPNDIDEAYYNYKCILYNSLPEHLKNEVNSPDYYHDFANDFDDASNLFHTKENGKNWSEPYVKEGKDIGRNDPCPCGSGKKYKKCCLNKKIN
ncbi:MAG: SEC-C domain-containing protein [Bacteroidales bacterium]|nr:SEC-C domain-containing protein [Bacteroidales bacterium]